MSYGVVGELRSRWLRVAVVCEPTCSWNGELPPKTTKSNQGYSCKVFLGGVPWDVTEGMNPCICVGRQCANDLAIK